MHRLVRLFLFVTLAGTISIASAQDTILVTVKLAKAGQAPANMPMRIDFPANCTSCKTIEDPAFARQNVREAILAMRVPRSTPLDLHIETDAASIRRVILETVDLPFEGAENGLHFILPAQITDRPDSGEFQSHLYWPGVELRFEHADPARRAGDYTSGDFPVKQRAAAANLEFGLLEAIRRLGLDHYVDDENLGRLFLMGFDTNDPHGHLDSPPHMHLTLWLPNYRATGSAIPHIYLTDDGLISHSLVGIFHGSVPSQDYKANDKLVATDNLGRPIFALTLTPEGWLSFARFDGPTCNLVPIGHGFDTGVKVSCPHFGPVTLVIEDDIAHSVIHEQIDGKPAASFHYDPDTGLLLQP